MSCVEFEMVASSEVVSAGKDLVMVEGSLTGIRSDCVSLEVEVVMHWALEWFQR